MKILFHVLCVSLGFAGLLKAEIRISKEFGFMADLPGFQMDTIKMDTPFGPYVGVGSVDKEKGFIYRVTVQGKPGEGSGKMDEAAEKAAGKANFDIYLAELNGLDVKWQWMEASAWPVIQLSYRLVGARAEGVTSYAHAYSFMRGHAYYNITVSGLEDNKELKAAAAKLFASFSTADEATLRRIEEGSK